MAPSAEGICHVQLMKSSDIYSNWYFSSKGKINKPRTWRNNLKLGLFFPFFFFLDFLYCIWCWKNTHSFRRRKKLCFTAGSAQHDRKMVHMIFYLFFSVSIVLQTHILLLSILQKHFFRPYISSSWLLT